MTNSKPISQYQPTARDTLLLIMIPITLVVALIMGFQGMREGVLFSILIGVTCGVVSGNLKVYPSLLAVLSWMASWVIGAVILWQLPEFPIYGALYIAVGFIFIKRLLNAWFAYQKKYGPLD